MVTLDTEMTSLQRDPRFYVVGGAVQPGRDCYLPRVADAELYRRITEGEYCHVLAQRQSGKSSLAAATVEKLRARNIGVALVDLTQASAEDPAENAGRWYYSIAYRITRDLRLRSDLQSWWAERGGLTNLQRLREFFQEIVLQDTDQPVAIFFDRVEATIGVPLTLDLFSCIRACYDARATNPEFNRLTFTLLSSASPLELVRNVQGSPFEIATTLQLPDFSPQEMAGLLAGLGEPPEDVEAVLARVWSWTRGHPYLSQKVFRGLARRKEENVNVASVDDLVQQQFRRSKVLQEDPHLSVIAEQLLQPGAGRVARLNLYGRVRKGVEVMSDPASAAEHDLTVAGLVCVDRTGQLQVRNEIYAMVFSTRWVNQNLPYGVRSLALAAAILVAIIALPLWYTEYLPRPYVRALSAANQDSQVAEAAYVSLARLPGYGATADRLFERFLVRASAQSTELEAVMQINSRLAALPGGVQRGQELLADFWQREAVRSTHAGNRDAALVALLESMQTPSPERRRLAAELTGPDYADLRGTLHSSAPVLDVRADADSARLTLLDVQNNAQIWALAGAEPILLRAGPVVAEERLQLELRRYFERLAAQPRLLVAIKHRRPAEVEVGLRAPSGQQAMLRLADGVAVADSVYIFDFSRQPEFAKLAAGETQGNWTLLVTDRERGEAGELFGWDLVGPGVGSFAAADSVQQPIPEPRITADAAVRLSTDGRFALAWPASPTMAGPVLVWDLDANSVIARIPRSPGMFNAVFGLANQRVLTRAADDLLIWDAITGELRGQIAVAAGGSDGLYLSPGGRFVAVAAEQSNGEPGIGVWDLESAGRVGGVIAASDAAAVAVDEQGRYLAIAGRDAWVRVWELQRRTLVRQFALSSPARALQFDGKGEWLVSDDLSSTLRLWNMEQGGAPVIERNGNSPWLAQFAKDSTALIYGSYDRPYEIVYLPEASNSLVRLRHPAIGGESRPLAAPQPIVLPALARAVTIDVGSAVKLWDLQGANIQLRAKTVRGGLRVALSNDGQRIATGTRIGDVSLFTPSAGDATEFPATAARMVADIPAEIPAEIVHLVFNADHSLLAAGTTDGSAHVWDSAGGSEVMPPVLHADGAVLDVLFTADGRYLVSASRLEVQLTDLRNGETAARLRIQADSPQLVIAAGTGELFIANDRDGVTAWDWRNGTRRTLVPGEYQVRKIAVARDGKRLYTAGADRVLLEWDALSGQLLQQSARAAGKVDDMWLTDGGRRLVVHAGHWLHALAVFPTGLAHRHTRFMPAGPVAVQPAIKGDEVYLLWPAAAQPRLETVALTQPPALELEGDPTLLRDYWRARVNMSIDAGGNVTPLFAPASGP